MSEDTDELTDWAKKLSCQICDRLTSSGVDAAYVVIAYVDGPSVEVICQAAGVNNDLIKHLVLQSADASVAYAKEGANDGDAGSRHQ